MNRSQIIFIVVPFLLIFGYQNCQKANYDAGKFDTVNPSQSQTPQNTQIVILQNESLESLQFKSNEVEQIPHGGSSYSLVKTLIYDFDIATGEFYVIDQSAQTNVRYCLTESLKNQMTALLNASTVCKQGFHVVEGQVCSQNLQDSYANLITNREQFRLGSATDSCGSNLVDLCEGSQDIKAWFNSIKPRLNTLQCQ